MDISHVTCHGTTHLKQLLNILDRMPLDMTARREAKTPALKLKIVNRLQYFNCCGRTLNWKTECYLLEYKLQPT